jgi:protein-L-isoaspartate(D-aspartate) O-methyltransferase
MVDELKKKDIIFSENVYAAMKKVPRHLFLPENLWHRAYFDSPQVLDKEQTISAPHMNAMMCEYLEIEPGQKILEIGTGSGYQAALLAELVTHTGKIITIERFSELAEAAKKVLASLQYTNIEIKLGDGTLGFEEAAPYDRILVTAAGPDIPRPLLNQLSPNAGIMCIPVGSRHWNQDLLVIRREGDKFTKQNVCKVMFVPLIGKHGFAE